MLSYLYHIVQSKQALIHTIFAISKSDFMFTLVPNPPPPFSLMPVVLPKVVIWKKREERRREEAFDEREGERE